MPGKACRRRGLRTDQQRKAEEELRVRMERDGVSGVNVTSRGMDVEKRGVCSGPVADSLWKDP